MPVSSEPNGAGDRAHASRRLHRRVPRQRGVRHIFGVDGANIEDLYDAAHFAATTSPPCWPSMNSPQRPWPTATAAPGSGIGVVAATSGGGCPQPHPGAGESMASRVPVLALIGQPPTTPRRPRVASRTPAAATVRLDAEALFSAVSRVLPAGAEPGDIVTALPAAIDAARPGGPAVLLLPKDIQQALDRGAGRRGHRAPPARRVAGSVDPRSDRSCAATAR